MSPNPTIIDQTRDRRLWGCSHAAPDRTSTIEPSRRDQSVPSWRHTTARDPEFDELYTHRTGRKHACDLFPDVTDREGGEYDV